MFLFFVFLLRWGGGGMESRGGAIYFGNWTRWHATRYWKKPRFFAVFLFCVFSLSVREAGEMETWEVTRGRQNGLKWNITDIQIGKTGEFDDVIIGMHFLVFGDDRFRSADKGSQKGTTRNGTTWTQRPHRSQYHIAGHRSVKKGEIKN